MQERCFYEVVYQLLEVFATDIDDRSVVEDFEDKFLGPVEEEYRKNVPYLAPELISYNYWHPLGMWLAENITMGTDLQKKVTWVMQKFDPSNPDQEFPEGINKHQG